MKILQTFAAFAAVLTSTFGSQAALAETSAPIKAHSNEPGDHKCGLQLLAGVERKWGRKRKIAPLMLPG
jgi:hypothetical protein